MKEREAVRERGEQRETEKEIERERGSEREGGRERQRKRHTHTLTTKPSKRFRDSPGRIPNLMDLHSADEI